jgi:hypothetical protein
MLLKTIKKWHFHANLILVLLLTHPLAASAASEATADVGTRPWWFWPLILFFFCFVLGVIAVLAGVGGGVLYVPLVSGFFFFFFIDERMDFKEDEYEIKIVVPHS